MKQSAILINDKISMRNIVILFAVISIQSFGFAQTIEPAAADKSVVYFVRTSGLGSFINFTYFDYSEVIGKFNGPKYMRYECEPGEHIFWARSENKDFVKAYLEPGKIYVIDVIPLMGGVKAGVSLSPINSADYNMKYIQKLLKKRDAEEFSKEQLEKYQKEMDGVIKRGMEKLKDLEGDIQELRGHYFQPEDLIYVKKKK